jgi:hypothetical protein
MGVLVRDMASISVLIQYTIIRHNATILILSTFNEG